MDVKNWRQELSSVLNGLCREIQVDDSVIDWVDIVIEQNGGGGRCPAHAHTWYEFNYVLSGRMQTRFMDKDVMVCEGEFFLIPPGMTHSHVYYRDDPHEGVCFRWRFRPLAGGSPEAAAGQSLFGRLSRLKDWSPGVYRDDYGIRPLLIQLFHEAGAGRTPLFLQLLLVQFLEILTSIPGTGRISLAEPGGTKDALVRKVEIYLEDFRGDRLNVEELAASLHMSYGHLSRLYKQKTGRTLIEEMNRIRLAKACELLLKPELLIKEVAEQSGFPDIYYFSKAFKKKHGLSPQAYRKRHLGREEPQR